MGVSENRGPQHSFPVASPKFATSSLGEVAASFHAKLLDALPSLAADLVDLGEDLEMPSQDPETLWVQLAEQTRLPPLEASLSALHAAGAAAEAKASPQGYIRHWTGQRTVPYMLRFLEEATSVPGAHARALLVILRMEQLLRSPFVDPRGEELLVLLLRHLCSDDTGLRAVFHCCDGETAYSALSADLVPSVASAELKEADASTTVLVLEDEAFPAEEDDKLPERRRWQMDQVLSHPAVLNLRTKHAEHDARQAHQSFDVVGSETVG
eukprot:s4013_g1.t2